MSGGARSVVDELAEHVAEIALGVGVEHGRVQGRQQVAVQTDETVFTGSDIQLVHGRGGIQRAKRVWPPLGRTRETLKEDLEWLRQLRTRSAR